MLKLENVSKTYKQSNVFKNVNVTFYNQSFNVLLGKSGAGKTTLLNIIGGLDKPTSGIITFDGTNIYNKNIDSYRNTFVSIVFQQLNLIEEFNIKQNLKIAFELANKEMTDASISEILSKVNLPDGEETIKVLLRKKPNQLSVGQKQRLAIARALIKNPQILLLDEPTSALDDDNAKSIVSLLKELSNKCTIIVSTHARDIFDKVADQIVELKEKTAIVSKNNAKVKDLTKNEQKYKKGFLSFRETFKFSVRNLKHKKVRLVTSFIIALISSVLFGMAYLVYAVDTNAVLLQTQMDNGIKVSSIAKYREYTYNSDDGSYIQTSLDSFTDQEIENINEYTNGAYIKINHTSFGINMFDSNGDTDSFINRFFYSFYYSYINETTASYFGFTPYEGLSSSKQAECHLPQNENEIVISRLFAEALVRNTFSTSTGGLDAIETYYDLDSVDELIGMTFEDYTIVGIYTMEDDMFDFWEEYITLTAEDANYKISQSKYNYLNNMRNGFAISQCIFGYEESISNGNRYLIKFSGNYSKDIKFLNSFSTDSTYVNLVNIYSGFDDVINAFENQYVSLVIWSIIAIFLTISFLISTNLFYANVKSMEKNLGILKAMGSSKEQTMLIVGAQAIFITLIEYILSLIGIVIFSAIFNSYFQISMITLNIVLALILLALLVLFAVLVSLIASAKAFVGRPINVIENK